MKMKTIYPVLLFFFALTIFTACKDDDDGNIEPSKTDLLVANEWVGNQVLLMGINVTESGFSEGTVPELSSLRLKFNSDNTYVAKSDDITFEGDWNLNQDETELNFDFFGLGEFEIKKLTETNLNLVTQLSKADLMLLSQILGIEVEAINNLPDGIELETEIRFIKP